MVIKYLYLLMSVIILSGCSQTNKNKSEMQKNEEIVKSDDKKSVTLHTIFSGDLVVRKEEKGLRFDNIQNKAVLLIFFATWCPPCKAEIPHLVNLQKKYSKNLKIISVLLEENKPDSEIKSFIKYNSINYMVANGKNNFKLSNMLGGIKSIPFMILYDKKGSLVTHYLGAIPEEMLNSDIKKVIK